MDEEGIRRNSQNIDAEASAPSGWTNTAAAAKALGVSSRTIQSYIHKGLLHGKVEGEGVRRTWYVSIDSLNMLRAQRLAEGDAEVFCEDSAENVAEGLADAMRNLAERLAEEAAQAAEFRIRLELTEKTESTVRAERDRLLEDLQRERARLEEVERNAVELVETREEARREAQRLAAELETERSKGFWRRLFG